MFTWFPFIHLPAEIGIVVKEDILEKSSKLFLSRGFKSVTMDDIANEMGMSKKTIYLYFENKIKLI